MSSRRNVRARARHVGRSRGLQQNHRHGILGRSFRARVASDARSLFAAAHPEPSSLPLQGFAGGIEQFDLQRLIGRDLKEKRSVAFHRRRPQPLCGPRAIPRVESNRMDRSGSKLVFRRIGIEAKQIWHRSSHASPRDAASAPCAPQRALAGLHSNLNSNRILPSLRAERQRPVSTTSIEMESSRSATPEANRPTKSRRYLRRILQLEPGCELAPPATT